MGVELLKGEVFCFSKARAVIADRNNAYAVRLKTMVCLIAARLATFQIHLKR